MIENLSTQVDIPSFTQARELAGLPPEQQREVAANTERLANSDTYPTSHMPATPSDESVIGNHHPTTSERTAVKW